ncbi:MAG: hypothetical protein IPJ74_01625 [Saprospiraceae bacterium]|nr:hypothetical protein [Saprospiraceae bacterium]
MQSDELGGQAFKDFDSDGTQDQFDIGQSGIVVTIYDCNGNQVGITVTDANGEWTVTGLTPGAQYRVEFSIPASLPLLEESFAGTDNGTSVQFVSPGTCEVDFGVLDPVCYCQENPPMSLACYENGSGVGNTNGVFVSIDYDYAGTNPMPAKDFDANTVGALWGVSYQKSNKRMFTSTFLKRHVGFGPRGADGVYVMDYSGAVPSLVGGFDLQGVVPSNGGLAIDLGTVNRTSVPGAIAAGAAGDFQLPADRTLASVDLDAFGKVGRTSYGDIDIEEDESNLWLVNLNQAALIAVDLNGYTPSAAIPATLPSALR